MSTPAAYAKMKEKQRQAEAVATTRAKEKRAEEVSEERDLYNKFAKALRPYRNCELGKFKVTVKFQPEKMKALLFVNGDHWATFSPERNHYSACDSDGYPTGEGSTWVTLDVAEHKKKKGYENYGMYFKCDIEELGDEDKFAEAIDDLVHDYEWKDF